MVQAWLSDPSEEGLFSGEYGVLSPERYMPAVNLAGAVSF